jgi:hypothetical protein
MNDLRQGESGFGVMTFSEECGFVPPKTSGRSSFFEGFYITTECDQSPVTKSL